MGAVADLDVSALTGPRAGFHIGCADSRHPWNATSQVRAHGEAVPAVAELVDDELVVGLRSPLRGVAPGQLLVLYRPDATGVDGDEVLGSATVGAAR